MAVVQYENYTGADYAFGMNINLWADLYGYDLKTAVGSTALRNRMLEGDSDPNYSFYEPSKQHDIAYTQADIDLYGILEDLNSSNSEKLEAYADQNWIDQKQNMSDGTPGYEVAPNEINLDKQVGKTCISY